MNENVYRDVIGILAHNTFLPHAKNVEDARKIIIGKNFSKKRSAEKTRKAGVEM